MRALALFIAAAAGLSSIASTASAAEILYTTDGTNITRFNDASLGTTATVPVTNLQTGETLVGIDVRPATQVLYGVGSTSRIYTINPITGVASAVSATQFTPALSGTAFGTDFNPIPDLIRQVSNTEQNLRLNPTSGVATTDTPLNIVAGSLNIVAAAYSNNVANASPNTLYGIDSVAGSLVRIGGLNGPPSPNLGAVTTIGSLGLGTNLNEAIGFDISGLTGTAFASITTGSTGPISRLYTINLGTGAATVASSNAGAIGSGATPYLGLAAAAAPEPAGLAFIAGAVGLLVHRRRRRAV